MCLNEEENVHDGKAVTVTCAEGFICRMRYLVFASILSSMEEKLMGPRLVKDSTQKQHVEEEEAGEESKRAYFRLNHNCIALDIITCS